MVISMWVNCLPLQLRVPCKYFLLHRSLGSVLHKKRRFLQLGIWFVCQCPRNAETLVPNQPVSIQLQGFSIALTLHWTVLGQRVVWLAEVGTHTHQHIGMWIFPLWVCYLLPVTACACERFNTNSLQNNTLY